MMDGGLFGLLALKHGHYFCDKRKRKTSFDSFYFWMKDKTIFFGVHATPSGKQSLFSVCFPFFFSLTINLEMSRTFGRLRESNNTSVSQS